jgi:hypothetical protein
MNARPPVLKNINDKTQGWTYFVSQIISKYVPKRHVAPSVSPPQSNRQRSRITGKATPPSPIQRPQSSTSLTKIPSASALLKTTKSYTSKWILVTLLTVFCSLLTEKFILSQGGTMLVIFILQWLFRTSETPKRKGPLPSLCTWNVNTPIITRVFSH